MTELRFTRRIREHAPEPTPQFTQAMEQALERIAREEEHPSRRRLTRRQVAAVVVDDSATLKRVYHLPVGVQLMPLNPAFAPMLFTPENSDSVRILGLAVGYFRKTV